MSFKEPSRLKAYRMMFEMNVLGRPYYRRYAKELGLRGNERVLERVRARSSITVSRSAAAFRWRTPHVRRHIVGVDDPLIETNAWIPKRGLQAR